MDLTGQDKRISDKNEKKKKEIKLKKHLIEILIKESSAYEEKNDNGGNRGFQGAWQIKEHYTTKYI